MWFYLKKKHAFNTFPKLKDLFVFSEVVECEEFLTLSAQQVSKLICSDRLTVPSEEKVSTTKIKTISKP